MEAQKMPHRELGNFSIADTIDGVPQSENLVQRARQFLKENGMDLESDSHVDDDEEDDTMGYGDSSGCHDTDYDPDPR
jgi:hypothetical protein